MTKLAAVAIVLVVSFQLFWTEASGAGPSSAVASEVKQSEEKPDPRLQQKVSYEAKEKSVK